MITNPLKVKTFEDFVKSDLRSYWIKEPGIELYVRRSLDFKLRRDYELANLVATHPGKGALTKFLNKYEPDYYFFIENIQQRRLVDYFLRRGYKVSKSNYGLTIDVYMPDR